LEIEIRSLSDGDRGKVTGILRRTPEFSQLDIEFAEEVIGSYLADPRGSGYFAFVAEVRGAVVGLVAFGLTPLTQGAWYVYWIVVDPEMKRKGIGTALLNFAEDRTKSSSGYLILIETSGTEKYNDTRRFYLSRGYREAFRVKDFYAPGDDLVTMEKRFD